MSSMAKFCCQIAMSMSKSVSGYAEEKEEWRMFGQTRCVACGAAARVRLAWLRG